MALKGRIPYGMSLPHRAIEPIDSKTIRQVAERADQLGFSDLWVTENTLDEVFSIDPAVALSFAAGVTKKAKLGVAVVILPVHNPARLAHQFVSLDHVSDGRAILGIGLGRPDHYKWFGVPQERRVKRFNESIEVMKALWTTGACTYNGELVQLDKGLMPVRPVHKPHPPLWFGGGHPDTLHRSVALGDAWMGAGGSTTKHFAGAVPILREALKNAGKDPKKFPISKRVFLSVHDDPKVARDEVDRWYSIVYHDPKGVETSGVHGTPEQVAKQLEALVDAGATHLLLNPVSRYSEQIEALAKIVGLA
jgi:alkanesulfonate monooxygenase SsuD/methylene tetrahydromethanopterin reductase-like flavin-dependent oxidoreductase (luciferase family)